MKTLSTLLFLVSLFDIGCGQSRKKIDPEVIKLNNQAVKISMEVFPDNPDSLKKAIKLLDKATAIDSNYAIGYLNKMNFQIRLKAFKPALLTAERLHHLSPDDLTLGYLLGQAYDRAGDSVSAQKYYKVAVTRSKKVLDTMSFSNSHYQGILAIALGALVLSGETTKADSLFASVYEKIPASDKVLISIVKPKAKKQILFPEVEIPTIEGKPHLPKNDDN